MIDIAPNSVKWEESGIEQAVVAKWWKKRSNKKMKFAESFAQALEDADDVVVPDHFRAVLDHVWAGYEDSLRPPPGSVPDEEE